MNLIETVVKEVLSRPYKCGRFFCVDVLGDSWGHVSESVVHCNTLEEAQAITVGYVFSS